MWKVESAEQLEQPMPEFMKRNMKLERITHPVFGLKEPAFTYDDRKKRYAIVKDKAIPGFLLSKKIDMVDKVDKAAGFPEQMPIFGLQGVLEEFEHEEGGSVSNLFRKGLKMRLQENESYI
eukprot:gene57469-biopygen28397